MGRVLALLLAAAAIAPAVGALLPETTGAPAIARAATDPAAYGPHLMLPNPDVYPRAPFVQPTGWTGTPPGTRGAANAPTATGPQDVLVLMIDFTDVQGAPGSSAQIGALMNGPTDSAADFYAETSWGQLALQGTVFPASSWLSSTRSMAYYGADSSTSSFDDANGPIYDLVVEAVQAADSAGMNFANPSFDRDGGVGDGVLDHLIVVHAGGAQEEGGSSNQIWSHRWSVVDADPGVPGNQRLMADGVQIYGYIMTSESSPLGVFVHELGHDFGLPDLYDTDDTDGITDGVGKWDVMGTGSWNALTGQNRGTMPAHFSAWSKVKLGWVQPNSVTSALLGQAIDQTETRTPGGAIPQVFKLPIQTTGLEEYFVIENRQQVGFDRGLPGAGLLIWHIDEAIPGNGNDAHRLVDLEEADGNDRPTQAADSWESTVDGFGPESSPNSNSYANQRTGWKVRNISGSGAAMTADLSREVDDDLVVMGIQRPWAVAVGGNAAVTITVGNRGAREQQGFAVRLHVYLDAYPSPVVCCSDQTVASLRRGEARNLSWTVPLASEGKYILEASVPLALDEIPENNFMFGHINAGTYYFHDDVEAGNRGWTRNGTGSDPVRWEIVQDGNTSGSHGGAYAWKFGPQTGLCVLCPEFHTLTSVDVSFASGSPLYFYLWHRYDLRGRVELNGSAETDVAYLNVIVDGTPREELEFTGAQSDWGLVYADLTQWAVGASTLVVQLSASSGVFTGTGGWWVDDIVVARTPLRGGLVARAVNSEVVVEPGGVAFFRFKLANVGDEDERVRFSLALPTGWSAAIGVNQSYMQAYDTALIDMGPDSEANLFLGFQVGDAQRGTRHSIPVTASSTLNTSISATFDTLTIINDPFGLAGLTQYLFVFLIVFAAVIVIAVILDAVKKQKGTYRRW